MNTQHFQEYISKRYSHSGILFLVLAHWVGGLSCLLHLAEWKILTDGYNFLVCALLVPVLARLLTKLTAFSTSAHTVNISQPGVHLRGYVSWDLKSGG